MNGYYILNFTRRSQKSVYLRQDIEGNWLEDSIVGTSKQDVFVILRKLMVLWDQNYHHLMLRLDNIKLIYSGHSVQL